MQNTNKKYFDSRATEWKVTQAEGKSPQVMVRLEVIEGPEAGQEKFYWGSLHENAVQYTFEALRAMGWTGNDLDTELDKEHGMGSVRCVAVEMDHEWPEGTIQRKIRYVNAWTAKKAPAGPTGIGKRFKSLAKQTVVPVDPAAKLPDDFKVKATVTEEPPF